MQRIVRFFEQGTALPLALAATAVAGMFAIVGLLVVPFFSDTTVEMRIEPPEHVVGVDETFTIDIVVTSPMPVNVFAGELIFDSSVLKVDGIDYNTSIADLWTERPWYSNGEGTLNFAGGTTRKGGFIGTGSLISVTFKTLQEGSGSLSIRDAHILEHDGLGTRVPFEPIDALFTIEEAGGTRAQNLIVENSASTEFQVITTPPSTDLNGDGKQSIVDVSIFMLNLASGDLRLDFNLDGEVNTKDLNILLGAE